MTHRLTAGGKDIETGSEHKPRPIEEEIAFMALEIIARHNVAEKKRQQEKDKKQETTALLNRLDSIAMHY